MGYYGGVPAGPPMPAGSNRQVQFNNNGVLDGKSGLIFRKSTNSLEVGGPVKATAQLTTMLTTAPADADLANDEMAIWFDVAAGRVAFKAKDGTGAVKTGFVPLT
ncbi:MAG: hypothetical protein ACREJ2_03155 [Planctomycetota bacterium]